MAWEQTSTFGTSDTYRNDILNRDDYQYFNLNPQSGRGKFNNLPKFISVVEKARFNMLINLCKIFHQRVPLKRLAKNYPIKVSYDHEFTKDQLLGGNDGNVYRATDSFQTVVENLGDSLTNTALLYTVFNAMIANSFLELLFDNPSKFRNIDQVYPKDQYTIFKYYDLYEEIEKWIRIEKITDQVIERGLMKSQRS